MVEIELTDRKETLKQQFQHQPIQRMTEMSELGEAVKELNSDEINKDNNLSAIDTRTRLRPEEVTRINQWDTLATIGVIPKDLMVVTLTKKRLAVSLFGKSRAEMVEVIAGKRETDVRRGSVGGALGNFFKGGQ